jgi:hypothetical protein
MQESLATEHGGELLTNTLEDLLDSSRVSDESGRDLETLGRNRAQSGLNVVGNPLNEVGRVLLLNVAHLILNLLGGNATAEDGGAGEVTAVAEIGTGHHVLGIEELLGELGDGDGAEGVRATASERSEANHEEMETREGDLEKEISQQYASLIDRVA